MNKINNIGLSRMLTSAYDFDGFTDNEVWARIAQKINIIIEHFNYLDKKIENEKENNKAKFDYLLGEGLTEQVDKALFEKIKDGTLGDLINNTLLDNINKKIDDLKNKINPTIYKTAIINFDDCKANYITVKNMTVEGVRIGDFIQLSTDRIHEYLVFTAMAIADNIISIRATNISPSVISMGDVVCNVLVTKINDIHN